MRTHKLSRRDARQIAIRAQWLDRERPAYLLELVRQLALLTIDPTAAIAPSAHLVAWSRLGGPYERVELDRALEKRELIELRGMIRPAEDVALYRAEMELWRTGPLQGWRKAQRDWVQSSTHTPQRYWHLPPVNPALSPDFLGLSRLYDRQ
jgi:uncharacterized protein YcaQ